MPPHQLVNLLLAVLGCLLTGMAGVFLIEFREMRKSVQELNKQMIKILGEIEHHAERLELLELHLSYGEE